MSPFVGLNPSTGITAGRPPLLLDQISASPLAAFSLRQLRAAYTGNAISVRRSSDNMTKDIGFTILGDLDLTTLLTFVGSSNGFVAALYDQVGSANLTMVALAQQPRIVKAGVVDASLDGVPGIYFGTGGTGSVAAGSNDTALDKLTGVTGFSTHETFVVHATNSVGPGFPECPNPLSAGGTIFYPFNAVQALVQDHNGNPANQEYGLDTAGIEIGENNLQMGTTSAPNPGPVTKFSYGSVNVQVRIYDTNAFTGVGLDLGNRTPSFGSFGVQSYFGWIMECLVFTTGLPISSADKATLFANQQAYYHIGTSLLGDTFNYQMTSAYSTRRLRKGYHGSCLKVRRSSDNSTLDIGFANNTLDTTSLLNFVGGGNGFIDTWYDQSPWANHVTQATLGNQPKIVNAGSLITMNGKAAIQFNSASNGTIFLQNPALAIATGWGGLFMIEQATGLPFPTGSTECALSSAPGNFAVFFGTHNTSNVDCQTNSGHTARINNVATNTLTGQPEHLMGIGDNPGGFGFVSGVTEITIGQQSGAANGSWVGLIGEIMCTSQSPALVDNTAIYQNQKAYWGTP